MPAEILGAKNGKTLCKKHRIKAVLLSGREVLPQTWQFYRRQGSFTADAAVLPQAGQFYRRRGSFTADAAVLPQAGQFYLRQGRISAFGSKINEAFVIVIVQLVSVL